MTSKYTTQGTWGGTSLTLGYNNSHSGAAAHDVFIEASSTEASKTFYTHVSGEKAIREFLYNFAVIGGIIKEGETLEIAEPSDKEVPKDGVYLLTGASQDRPIAIVQGGRVLIPQPEQTEIIDYTDVFLSKYSQWELTPLVKTERRNVNYA